MDTPTRFTTTFIPLTVEENGLYRPAVRMVSELHGESTTVYVISLENEKMAMAMARDFASQERERYAGQMTDMLQQMADNLKRLR